MQVRYVKPSGGFIPGHGLGGQEHESDIWAAALMPWGRDTGVRVNLSVLNFFINFIGRFRLNQ